jgi:hypothetical protein
MLLAIGSLAAIALLALEIADDGDKERCLLPEQELCGE